MKCKYCGNQIPHNADWCEHCGKEIERGFLDKVEVFFKKEEGLIFKIRCAFKKLLTQMGVGEKPTRDLDYYERGKQIAPDCIELDNGEIPIKQYNLAKLRSRLKFTTAEGRMQITNKRLIFRASGFSPAGKTLYQNEFALDKIDGIEIRKDYRFRGIYLLLAWVMFVVQFGLVMGTSQSATGDGSVTWSIFAIAFAVILCMPFFVVYKRYFLKLCCAYVGSCILSCSAAALDAGEFDGMSSFVSIISVAVAIIGIISLFLLCLQPNLVIEVKTGGSPAMQIRHKYTSFFIWRKMEEYSGFAEVIPWEDADLAIKEIGAIINDVKTLGDMGVEKWKDAPKNKKNK